MDDPILTAIAGALAKEAVAGGTKALAKLVHFVKDRFRHDPGAEIVLASAQEHPEDPTPVEMLARVLRATGERDPEFASQLRALWAASNTTVAANQMQQTALGGSVANNVNGNIGGNLVQAGEVGEIHLRG